MLAFPLPAADFWGKLHFERVSFDLPAATQSSRTAGGEVIVADIGTRLWRGDAMVLAAASPKVEWLEATLARLASAGASFMAFDPRKTGPKWDRGAKVWTASPVIAALNGDARLISVGGLPLNYELAAGDMLGFQYGSPARHALHQVVDVAVPAPSGTTALLEVVPPIRPGATIGAAVTLHRPACKAVIVPGSVSGGGRSGRIMTDGIAFSWVQTLK
jgi:hypothetical protein